MTLSYRALLVPTAAIDSAGRAKPNAAFSVTPMAGGSPVAVYGAAQGGSALAADQIKTDALGNISGLYVADPGPYMLSFAGGGTVVTSAVMDSRDVATTGELADALLGSGGTAFVTDPVESWGELVDEPVSLGTQYVNINTVPPGNPGDWVGGPDLVESVNPGGAAVLHDGIYLVRVGTKFDVKDDATSNTLSRQDVIGYTETKLRVTTPGSYTPEIVWQSPASIGVGSLRFDYATLFLPAGAVLSGAVYQVIDPKDSGSAVIIHTYLSKFSLSLVRFL